MHQTQSTIRLGDDGTLDTVIYCVACGREYRFNYDPSNTETEANAEYDAFVAECIAEIEAEHTCEEDPIHG